MGPGVHHILDASAFRGVSLALGGAVLLPDWTWRDNAIRQHLTFYGRTTQDVLGHMAVLGAREVDCPPYERPGAWRGSLDLYHLFDRVVVPIMAMALGDTTSPLSLGKQEFDFPDLFAVVLELCLAGLFVIAVYAWVQRKPNVRSLSSTQGGSLVPGISQIQKTSTDAFKSVAAKQSSSASAPPASSESSAVKPVIMNSENAVSEAVSSQDSVPTPAKAQIVAASAAAVVSPKPQAPVPGRPGKTKSARATKPEPVYYNIVGERITPADDDDIDAQ